MNKKNLSPSLVPYAKLNSKWMIDLNIKCKTRKLLGDDLRDTGSGGVRYGAMRRVHKGKIDKLDFLKIKTSALRRIMVRE